MKCDDISSPGIEVLDLDVRTFNHMKRAGISTIADVERLANNITDAVRPTLSEAHRKAIEAYKVYRNSLGQQESPAEISAPAQTDTAVAAFDYSVLDNDTAHSLKECETVIRTETAGYFTILGAKFKEAQELLANHSSGTFEQWYTSMGFKRQTVYNLIQRFEFSSSPTIGGREEAFEALPLTLSYEISKPAAPAELVDKVLDGDITTNAEYRRLKAELEEAKKKLEDAKYHSKQQSESFDRVSEQSSVNYHKYLDEIHKNQDLMKQIRELEARPVEATFIDNSEELEEKDKEISELKEEIERLSDKNVKVFTIRLTIDEFEKLFGIVKESNDFVLMEAVKKAQIIRL